MPDSDANVFHVDESSSSRVIKQPADGLDGANANVALSVVKRDVASLHVIGDLAPVKASQVGVGSGGRRTVGREDHGCGRGALRNQFRRSEYDARL